ncbi:helicase-exonuclease AddAB subunit AddB [Aquisalibacillus elongatus]|uniref:ATP-dependent helicase/deoxyribonuclease subunit B n=1 Tax=Aquisalibacillus elongatus TaxID=485577 RepID=A0A3N5B990_9BACI|nr:helicase-exonuclease AddAB subunit AddB [Aquisalibacillus elongatus]RPF52050.1 DNA helicase/exodeoxyribonuclease V subunit B [Aquisalibacillus elongatus]
MALQFILGRSGSEFGHYVLNEITEEIKQDPQGDPIFYLVPDQMAFQQEYDLVRKHGVNGSIRAQVFSFSRLAWYIFNEVGGATKPFISSTGIQMMLRKLAEEQRDSLQAFQEAIDKQGFIEHLESMITEIKRYRITPESLHSVVMEMAKFQHTHPNEVALKNKLSDLSLIYNELDQHLRGHYIDREDQLELMVEKIKDTGILSQSTIYIDGFHRFTPQEYYVIEALMKYAKNVHITMMINPGVSDGSELDLFYQTKTTLDTITEIAEDNAIEIEEPYYLSPQQRFKGNRGLEHLERYFETQPTPEYDGDVSMKLVESVHPRAEVEGVAQEITRLVRDEDYRYRDMALLIRQPEVYHDLIETIFEDYQIPVFIDEKKTMLNHPFVELIRTGIEIVNSNWRYDAVFRLLKTGFVPKSHEEHPLTEEAIDTLENYVLEYGIRRRDQWISNERWPYQRFTGLEFRRQTDDEKEVEEKINAYREQVASALKPLDDGLRSARTVSEKCQAIFEWLEQINAPRSLERLRDQYDEAGRVETAREQEQVWQAVMELLDEMVEMIGDDEVSTPMFLSIVEAGFDTLTFAQVPPTIDHVIIGSVERSRLSDVKVGFVLGAVEGVYPQKPPNEGMVTDDERLILENHGVKLADRAERVLLDDRFYMYIAFTLASEKLWVSYPLSDEEGRSKVPAPIVKRLQTMFPEAERKFLMDDEDEHDPLRFITNREKTRAILTAELSKYLRGYPVSSVYWDTLHWYVEHEVKGDITQRVLQSLFYRPEPENLKQETVSQLYDETIRSSVSRLETYHQCSYHYFAQYTLGLQERNTFQLAAPDIGQLFHESLRAITEWVYEEGKAFFELSDEEIKRYARRAVEQLAPVLNHQILFSSNRYKYILRKLEQVIIRATNVLAYQARHSDFTPAGIEIGFGKKQKLPPLQLNLPQGYKLELSGRIDRVDQAEIDDQLYLRIIDYKSSNKDLSLVDVYYGLALQMLTYLDVVLTHSSNWVGKQAEPAGVLYFHVHNPTISDPKTLDEKALEEEVVKAFKMNGLLLEDEQVAQAMDQSIDSGTSKIAPFGVKKDGSFRSGSKTVDQTVFERMNDYVRNVMTQAGSEIVGGQVKLNPFQKKDMVACTYCPFQSVCQFDPTLDEHEYRRLKEDKDEIMLQKMLEREEDR